MVYRVFRRTGPKRFLDPESLRNRKRPPQRPFEPFRAFRLRLPHGAIMPPADEMTPRQIAWLRLKARTLRARILVGNGLLVHPTGTVEYIEGDELEIGPDDPWPTRAEALRMLAKRRRPR